MSPTSEDPRVQALPKPRIRPGGSFEETLASRRARRTFATGKSVTLAQLAQLLWAGQGVTGDYDRRTAPSAGGLHPLHLQVVAGNVDGLATGVYRYRASLHELVWVADGDARDDLRRATQNQECLGEGALDIVIAADPTTTLERYGDRGWRYLYMEAGHISQNIYLEAAALGLATTSVAAFDDEVMATGAGLTGDEVPVYAMPVGLPL